MHAAAKLLSLTCSAGRSPIWLAARRTLRFPGRFPTPAANCSRTCKPPMAPAASFGSSRSCLALHWPKCNLTRRTAGESRPLPWRDGRALVDFSHPAANRILKWDLSRSLWAFEKLTAVADPQRRALAEHFLNLFEREAVPRFHHLRRSVIYAMPTITTLLSAGIVETQRGRARHRFWRHAHRPDRRGACRRRGLRDFWQRGPDLRRRFGSRRISSAFSSERRRNCRVFHADGHAARRQRYQLCASQISHSRRSLCHRHRGSAWAALERLARIPVRQANDRLLAASTSSGNVRSSVCSTRRSLSRRSNNPCPPRRKLFSSNLSLSYDRR